MYRQLLCVAIFSISFFLIASAQENLYMPRNIQRAYNKGTRSENGSPGKNYWQNSADYIINIDFDPSTLLLSGSETILYNNNSKDTLKKIIFKLYPNLYKAGAKRMVHLSPADVGEGIIIDKLGLTASIQILKYEIDETNMIVTIPPLLPSKSIKLEIDFHYLLNRGSHFRTGHVEPNADFLAYFFPRIAVYDDIDGWNMNPYLGTQEFYNDFSNFKVAITVPKKFFVWATGDLNNCKEVMAEKFCTRLLNAEQSDSVIDIVDSIDIAENLRRNETGTNTWHFTATNVTDFAFALSDHYVWKSTSIVVDPVTKRRTRSDAVYNLKHEDFEEVIHFNRETVKNMSYLFPKWPFPYAHMTVFDGLDQMEYPMMANDNPVDNRTDAITLTDHEIFHTMFPFYMGTNETKYGWMDEGWATIGEWLISPMIDSTIVDDYGMKQYDDNAGKEIDVPMTTLTTLENGPALFLNSYVKPALGYLYVKDYLGDELFTKALHHYIREWNGKHPMPFDFFNCMNVGSGKNLNWFWKKWFFETGAPDLAISTVNKKVNNYLITISLKGSKPTPIDLIITFDDNSTIKEHRSIGVWETGNNTVEISIAATKTIKVISLGNTYAADVNKTDNIWRSE